MYCINFNNEISVFIYNISTGYCTKWHGDDHDWLTFRRLMSTIVVITHR